jgi:hypothetical protein
MLQLLMMILLATPVGMGPGDRTMPMGMSGVTDKTALPPKIPDCRTDDEIKWALAQKANGEPQSCDPPRKRTPPANQPH